MLLILGDVLSPEQLDAVQSQIAFLDWTDGARTAGERARRVKQNEQADLSSGIGPGLHERLLKAVSGHPVLRAAAQPKTFSRLLVSRTSDGGGYGAHIDNALMAHGIGSLRSDLSFTLFLTPPEDYDGGELRIHLPGGEEAVKLAAGDLVLYPSTTIHEVAPVTRGERLVCVGWIESLVREADRREILFDLEHLRTDLRAQLPPDAPQLLALDKSVANLLRMWAAS